MHVEVEVTEHQMSEQVNVALRIEGDKSVMRKASEDSMVTDCNRNAIPFVLAIVIHISQSFAGGRFKVI